MGGVLLKWSRPVRPRQNDASPQSPPPDPGPDQPAWSACPSLAEGRVANTSHRTIVNHSLRAAAQKRRSSETLLYRLLTRPQEWHTVAVAGVRGRRRPSWSANSATMIPYSTALSSVA